MPELRQNRVTKEWVIVATERAKRPEELTVKREQKVLPHYSEKCPFCPGNESMAPPEVLRVERGGKWEVRVFPNKFPALSRDEGTDRKINRSQRSMSGFGIHDVIVETPDHAATTALLTDNQVLHILGAYRRRYIEVSFDPRVVHITLFKNHGLAAGTSLEHPHSQMIATPVISHQVRERMYEALRHYDEYGECLHCEVLKEELSDGERVVVESEHFAAIEPFASPTPFTTHIYPRRHFASFGDITDRELEDMARVLRTVLAKLYAGLRDPDYNYTIRTAPAESKGAPYYHWYLSIIPRLTHVAGFELGSGMFINTVMPEQAAKFLREVSPEAAVQPAKE